MTSIWYVIGSYQTILRYDIAALRLNAETQPVAVATKTSLLNRLANLNRLLTAGISRTDNDVCAALERVSRLLHVLTKCARDGSDMSRTNFLLQNFPRFLRLADDLPPQSVGVADEDVAVSEQLDEIYDTDTDTA
jgi:hypothetical protein